VPKYHKSFRAFWEQHVDEKYIVRECRPKG
jgi:hypothetical protein